MNLKSLLRSIVSPARRFFNNRKSKKLLFALSKLPDDEPLTLIDIGAAGDIEPRWKRVAPALSYIGFEPDERSRLSLLGKENSCAAYKILPFGVWNHDGEIELNLCKMPLVSSHFTPNKKFTDLFPDATRFDVLSVDNMKTRTLDSLDLDNSDFIKIDIQGGELNALKGGEDLLKNTLGLEVEVEFIELYNDQPLFGEICSFLDGAGFEFFDFVNFSRWERQSHNTYGQCTFGDALFLRSPENVLKKNMDGEWVSKYLGICLIYNRFDLIDMTISLLPKELSALQDEFIKAIKPLRNSNKIVRFINKLVASVFSLFGFEYRAYLIY
jgi:FkbM family methyltransferase